TQCTRFHYRRPEKAFDPYFMWLAKKSAVAEYAAIQSRCSKKSWISSGKISSWTSTFCLRSASANCTVCENCTLRSSSPWINSTGERHALIEDKGDEFHAMRAASGSASGS